MQQSWMRLNTHFKHRLVKRKWYTERSGYTLLKQLKQNCAFKAAFAATCDCDILLVINLIICISFVLLLIVFMSKDFVRHSKDYSSDFLDWQSLRRQPYIYKPVLWDLEAPLKEIYIFEYTLPSERYALVTQLSLKVNTAVWRGHIENDQLGYISSRLTCD